MDTARPADRAATPSLLRELTAIVGARGVVASVEGRLTYECDMHTFFKGAPDVVVLPESAAQVADVVRLCRREGVPLVPRGSGTGLIGGAMASRGGVMVATTRMNRILEIDLPNRSATVEPGLINLALSEATRPRGYYFAPDPSSQMVSSIGGNASTNAGGPHCLKYGITVNHVLGLQVVTGAGELVWLGGKTRERPGYDLTGVVVGGEGTLGLVTAVTVRLMHVPEGVKTVLASFSSIEDASEAVSAIIADGIIPAALELLDEVMIRAIEEGVGAGYPKGAAAVLLIELDGPREEIEAQSRRVEAICRERLALEIRVAKNDAERALLWKGRKEAAGAFGRLTPTWLLQDAVVPRSKLPQIMREVLAIAARHRLMIANVFHAGDGNIHPLICYDDRVPDELARAKQANEELLQACLALGGSVTGEHGVGIDKAKNLQLQIADTDLNIIDRLRRV
ncbi:MAG: FAD-linked oxidase C-terminal domain-containing protein, partial [Candidatus Rokuibacteriota bacterium]